MKFVEIEKGLSINFDKVVAIGVNDKDPSRTDIFVESEKFVTSIPHDVLKQLLNAGSNDLAKYVKQLATNQRFATP